MCLRHLAYFVYKKACLDRLFEVPVSNHALSLTSQRIFQARALSLVQSQFGVGLREAAHNLRICPTTLKRACRRHGIYRWPRRQSWGGGSGDAGRTESMNLDGDSVSSAGLHAGCDQPGVVMPAQGSIAVCCHLS